MQLEGGLARLRVFFEERAAQGDPKCLPNRRFVSETIQSLSDGSPLPLAPPRSWFSPLPKERSNAATVTRGSTRVTCNLFQGHQYHSKREGKAMESGVPHHNNSEKLRRGESTVYTLVGRREEDVKV